MQEQVFPQLAEDRIGLLRTHTVHKLDHAALHGRLMRGNKDTVTGVVGTRVDMGAEQDSHKFRRLEKTEKYEIDTRAVYNYDEKTGVRISSDFPTASTTAREFMTAQTMQ